MSALDVRVESRQAPLERIRRLDWYHPEWTVALLAAAGWILLLVLHYRGSGPLGGHATLEGHGALGHSGAGHASGAGAGHVIGWPAAQARWLLMSVAMMLPPALPAARHVAMTGKWRRRRRGPAAFAGAYLATWALFGLLAITTARWLQVPAGARWPLVAALLVAAAWELVPLKRRCLRACHRTISLPPEGWKADVACMRFGVRYGWACMGACWALMVPMALPGHVGLGLMVLLAGIVFAEEGLVKGTLLVEGASLALIAVAALIAMSPAGVG